MRRLQALAALLVALVTVPPVLADGSGPMEPFPNSGAYGQIQDPSLGERIFGGLAGVGTGIGKLAAGAVGTINYAANWGSMLTGGFGNEQWAMEHAGEISGTHDTVVNVATTVTTREGWSAMGQQLSATRDAWLAGDMKAMAQLTGFFAELGTGAAVSELASLNRLGALVPDAVPPRIAGQPGTAARLSVEASDGASTARTVGGSTQRSSSQVASRRSTPAEAQAPPSTVSSTQAPRSATPEPDVVASEIEALRSLGARNRSATAMHERISGNTYIGNKARDAAGRLRDESGRYAEDGAARAREAVERSSRPAHGNTAGDQPAYLYARYDAEGRFLKYGVTQDLNKRYTFKELAGGFLRRLAAGPRRLMLRQERELVETQPGPLNLEPWAGARRVEK